MKMLCRSHTSTAVCRSNASTAVCLTDPRAVISPRRSSERAPYGGIKYSRLGDTRRSATGGDRIRAVTLSMVTKRERAPPEPKQPSTTTTTITASNTDQLFQVVVMRVSIHCQGCAGKVRKHISKMEGVTSFNIDVESKRVTVMGHVSPVSVLESISKVKRAEFWTC